jgi:putative ABC transport system permease protein
LMTESLLLSVVAGLSAGALALAAARPLAAATTSLPTPFPIALEFAVDWKLLAAAAGFAVATMFAFGLVPALQSSKRDVLPALRDGAATAGAGRSRWRAAFMVSQVALSTLLLVLAGLLVRGVLSARALDRGFTAAGVLTASIDLESGGYRGDRGGAFHNTLLDRLERAPGIAAATIVDIVPLTLSNRVGPMIADSPSSSGAPPMVYRNRISRGHFRTLGIPLLGGRDFDSRDRADATPVAIVNETLAARFWPGDNPIGKRLRDWNGREPSGPWLEVVGLARDSKYVTLGEDPKAFMYRPLDQEYVAIAFLLVKSAGAPMDALPRLRSEVEALDANLPLFGVMTLDAATGISVLPVKITATLAGMLGLVALTLGAIGLYGVMTYLVRQRTREIGVRMALGARPASVVRLVVGHGMRWTAIGLAIGLAASFGVATLIAGFLYGVAPADPVALMTIVVLLGGTAYAACYLPARRASRIDPLEALRDE